MRRRVMVIVMCVCVYLSIKTLATVYLVYTSKIRCQRVLYGVVKVFVMWLLLKTLCSKVLASFADHDRLSCFLMSSPWPEVTAMASFQQD